MKSETAEGAPDARGDFFPGTPVATGDSGPVLACAS
jgi:hypothetical protein